MTPAAGRERGSTKSALLFDDDLGFLFWLADVLCGAGYQAYPAERLTDAVSLLGEIQGGVHLAMVNLRLPEAVSLVKLLAGFARSPEIMVLEPGVPDAALPEVSAWLGMPDTQSGASLAAWRDALRKRLAGGGNGMSPWQSVDRPS